ncbi:MAG: hypothetical protein AAGM38_03025 [Pseudomonadota bacterium]
MSATAAAQRIGLGRAASRAEVIELRCRIFGPLFRPGHPGSFRKRLRRREARRLDKIPEPFPSLEELRRYARLIPRKPR